MAVRRYSSGSWLLLLVSYEDWAATRFVMKGRRNGPRAVPTTIRPTRDVPVAYDSARGLLAVGQCRASDATAIRHCFGAAFLGDGEFFEQEGADRIFDLQPVAREGFSMECFEPVESATITKLVFASRDRPLSKIVVEDEDALAEARRCGLPLGSCEVAHALFSFRIPGHDDGCSVMIAGRNRAGISDSGFIDAVYRHLRQWGIVEERALGRSGRGHRGH